MLDIIVVYTFKRIVNIEIKATKLQKPYYNIGTSVKGHPLRTSAMRGEGGVWHKRTPADVGCGGGEVDKSQMRMSALGL